MTSQALPTALAFALSISVGHAALPILPGDYVRAGYRCYDAPFAALFHYDGAAFSGPHESDCTTRVLSHSGPRYRLGTTCRVAGDGSPLTNVTEVQAVVVLSPSRLVFEHRSGNIQIDSATYNRCSKGPGDAGGR